MEMLNEKIKEFLNIESNYNYGYGCGPGNRDGRGSSCGHGNVNGKGYSCSCDSSSDGSSSGKGFGCGCFCGSGDDDDSGRGCGLGFGCDNGIKKYCGNDVYLVDGVQTIITSIIKGIAKGFILNSDLTLDKCFVVKSHNKFAHGVTIQKAMEDLQNKIFEDMDTDEAIELFIKEFPDKNKKYPAKDFYIWHNRLTGSCELGRNQFVKNGGYDLENDMFTVDEFINITENDYGGEIIKQLKETIK